MYEFWCGVIMQNIYEVLNRNAVHDNPAINIVRSATLTTHQKENIYIHIKPITFLITYALQSQNAK